MIRTCPLKERGVMKARTALSVALVLGTFVITSTPQSSARTYYPATQSRLGYAGNAK